MMAEARKYVRRGAKRIAADAVVAAEAAVAGLGARRDAARAVAEALSARVVLAESRLTYARQNPDLQLPDIEEVQPTAAG